MCLNPIVKQLAAVVALIVALPASAAVIDFEGTNAPIKFSDTTPLSNYYASLGVTFSGVDGVGGSILSDYADLGVTAFSGFDFLAMNDEVEAATGQGERITFASAQQSVSIYAATYISGAQPEFFTFKAFDVDGKELAAITQAATRDWQALTINHAGIRSVLVEGTTLGWALDDLSFEAGIAEVPEPGSLALLGASMLGLAALRRKRKA